MNKPADLPPSEPQDFGWLVDNFALSTPGVMHALIVSSDGLPLITSAGLAPDLADPLAAMTSGIISIGNNIAGQIGEPGCEQVMLKFPSGRSAEEVVVRDAAGLAWAVNLGCIDMNPHPVRAQDLEHPDELRVDLDPVPGVEWAQIVSVALVARQVLTDFGLTGWPKTSGSRGIHIYARIEPRWTFTEVRGAAVALAREIERRAPGEATARWWKEERHGVFVDYNQNAKDRTVASAYSVRPRPDARVSAPLTWDEVPGCRPEEFTIDTMPARFAALGDVGAGIDEAVGSLEPLLALYAADEAAGVPDAPWPPHYEKQSGEAPRVQPSKRRAPDVLPAAPAERGGQSANLAGPVRAEVDGRVPAACGQGAEVLIPVPSQVRGLREQTRSGPAPVKDGDLVAAVESGPDEVAADELSSADGQDAHPGSLSPRWSARLPRSPP